MGRILDDLGHPTSEIDIVFVSDKEISHYNKKFLGRTGPTDVISFPMEEEELLGSVVISTDTAARQAKDHGRTLWDELKVLIIHGTLHLVGYDHGYRKDAERMRRKERALLKRVNCG